MGEIKHITVFEEPGTFAGWPANHGGWQWGDEFLTGFITGEWCPPGMHHVRGELTKRQARSRDGGLTWKVEDPGVDFEAGTVAPPPEFKLGGKRGTIIRVCGGYDHGGDDCINEGGFYLSHDRGKTWYGAYSFVGLEQEFSMPMMNTSRTAVVGKRIFLSSGYYSQWGADLVIVASHDGRRFNKAGEIREVGRVVMPSPVVMADGTFLAAVRRRGPEKLNYWIDVYRSLDRGRSWSHVSCVTEIEGDNGNPPALIEQDGLLVCVYVDRALGTVRHRLSRDVGISWEDPVLLRANGNWDIGYPRTFKRLDGGLVCVYYWADDELDHQRIEATHFRVE